MSSKLRGSTDYKSLTRTFAADVAAGVFGYVAAQKLIYHVLAAVDVSVDAEGEVAYEAPRILLPKATGQTWVEGDQLYYNISANNFRNVTSAVTDIPAGLALTDAGTTATECLADFRGSRLGRPKLAGAGW